MITRVVHAIGGTFILGSLLLGIYINSNCFWLTGVVGVNMWIYALTNWCLMEKIIKKTGIKNN